MTKILWFSRHKMSEEQHSALVSFFGDIKITQVNGTAQNVHMPFTSVHPRIGEGTAADEIFIGETIPLKDLVKGFDEVAAVLPIGMQQQILPFIPSGRILQALNGRVIDESGKVNFVFQKWEAITKIVVEKENL